MCCPCAESLSDSQAHPEPTTARLALNSALWATETEWRRKHSGLALRSLVWKLVTWRHNNALEWHLLSEGTLTASRSQLCPINLQSCQHTWNMFPHFLLVSPTGLCCVSQGDQGQPCCCLWLHRQHTARLPVQYGERLSVDWMKKRGPEGSTDFHGVHGDREVRSSGLPWGSAS